MSQMFGQCLSETKDKFLFGRRSLILIWCRLSIATDDRLCFGDHVLDKGSGEFSTRKEIDIFFNACSGPNSLLRYLTYFVSLSFSSDV